jgi:hypothetical protein
VFQVVKIGLGSPGRTGRSLEGILTTWPRSKDRRSPQWQVSHIFLQAVSSETTPVLSHAIINFEEFMTGWERLGKKHKILRPWSDIGLRWVTKYYVRMDDTEVYILTIYKLVRRLITVPWLLLRLTVLNPATCFTWIELEWGKRYISQAKEIILKRVSTIIRFILYLHDGFCRCASTMTRHRWWLQWHHQMPQSSPLQSLKTRYAQHGSELNILHSKRSPCRECWVSMLNFANMLYLRSPLMTLTSCGFGRWGSFGFFLSNIPWLSCWIGQ